MSVKCDHIRSAGLLLLSLVAFCIHGEEKFTLAVIPDSQQEVLKAGDDRLQKRMEWIVANRKSLNLKMVLHVGDLMNWDTPDHIQYERASSAMAVLDHAGLPYVVALGNHDTAATTVGGKAAPGKVNVNLRNTTTFNTYFPVARFKVLGGLFEINTRQGTLQTRVFCPSNGQDKMDGSTMTLTNINWVQPGAPPYAPTR